MKSIVLEELIILRSIQISQNRFDPALNVLSLNKIFLKNGPTPASSNTHYKFYNKWVFEKMSCPFSKWCRDSNSRTQEHETPPITTRPGLAPLNNNFQRASKLPRKIITSERLIGKLLNEIRVQCQNMLQKQFSLSSRFLSVFSRQQRFPHWGDIIDYFILRLCRVNKPQSFKQMIRLTFELRVGMLNFVVFTFMSFCP